VPDQQRHQVLVHQTHQHHPGHLERGLVGHPVAVDEGRLDPQALGHGGDLRAASVDDHRTHAHQAEQGHVLGEGGGQYRVLHGGPADLHHDGRPGVLLHERQRLQQDPGLRPGPLANLRRRGDDGHVVYSPLIRTYS
jgi:hypothetical protein